MKMFFSNTATRVAVLITALATAAMTAVPAWGGCLVTGESFRVGAGAAVVMEAASGTLLFSQEPHKQLAMASTTKIMTALIALEQEEVDTPFVVDAAAIMVEGSSMGLQEGDIVTLRALAGGMLMASGNDGAQAAAVQIGGSIREFAQVMNARARSIGMNNTNFVTPSGLDAADHYSTAYDMALLGREALKNPAFAEMCAAPRLTLSFGNPPYDRSLVNHNRLISRYEGAVGIKTGFTKKSGRCLVSAATRNGVTLICVTLDCGDDWDVHQSLYDRYFPMVTLETLSPDSPILVPVTGGAASEVALVPTADLTWPIVRGAEKQVSTRVFAPQFLYAPIFEGDIVGKMVYYIDDLPVGEVPLAAAREVPATGSAEEKNWWSRLWNRDG